METRASSTSKQKLIIKRAVRGLDRAVRRLRREANVVESASKKLKVGKALSLKEEQALAQIGNQVRHARM